MNISYVCILSGWYENNWYEINLEAEGVNCTKEQMRIAAEGHLTTEAIMWNQDNRKTISGMVINSDGDSLINLCISRHPGTIMPFPVLELCPVYI